MARRGTAEVIPEALRRWRDERGLTQHALSTSSGCSEALIAHAEAGRRNLSLHSVIRIAGVLEVPITAIAHINATAAELAAARDEVAA